MRTTDHYRRIKRKFLDGFIDGFGGIGNFGPTEIVRRKYPKESIWNDWERLGKDFYNAFGLIDEQLSQELREDNPSNKTEQSTSKSKRE